MSIHASNNPFSCSSDISNEGSSALYYDDFRLNADTFNLPNITLFRKINLTEVHQFAGVEIQITNNDFGKVFEFGIYDSLGNRITSTGLQEIEKGKLIFPLEDYTLTTGEYYVAFFTNANNTSFAFSKNAPSESSTLVNVLPESKPTTNPSLGFIAYRLIQNQPTYIPSELEEYSDGAIRVLGINGSQPWAWNTTTGRMAYSVSNGATFIDMMPIDTTWGWSPIDLVTDGINLYVLMFDFTILKSSDMTATATWSNITPPDKNIDAKGFPYCLNIWNGYLYAGEYSGTLPLATPPKLHKMELSSQTWSVAKQFTNAKHIHAVQSPGSAVMYVVCGDQGYGTDVGIHRITQANQATDTFQKVTAGETLPYPVNLEFIGTKIYGSGDQPPVHIISTRAIGSLGNFRLNANNFKESTSEAGETCRAIKADTEGNLYYLAVETSTSHALYVSPPPYIHRFKISNVINDTGVNGRTVRSGDYFMNYEMRWKKVTFSYNRLTEATAERVESYIGGRIGTALTNPTGAQVIKFDEFNIDNGTIDYEVATGKFTFNKAGKYMITFNAVSNSGSTRVALRKNALTASSTLNDGQCYSASAYFSLNLMSVLDIEVGDYIVYYLIEGSIRNQTSDKYGEFTINKIA